MQNDPLAFLAQDAYREIHKKKPATQLIKPQCRQSIYRDPRNWKLGKCVQLVHITEGTIGIFREHFHRLSPTARRLLPAPAGTPIDRNELVFGDWWLHPRVTAPLVKDTEEEAHAISLRFNELIEEYFSDK
jgi:hypothetical protein